MPGKVGVKIKAGRNLPVMDRGSDTTDAYVEIKLGNTTHKTDVCRKSLNPCWNTDWFRFEVDDAELQDEPLQIRLMDYDTYSANDAIGKVNISLNPLCLETSGQATHAKCTVLSGWIPVFDTMHGIRGEVNVIVKVDLFSDVNKFRQSSCGIQFFHSQCVPYGYRAQVIHGFVEELVVNDDPEYQWIDKIRTPRASNEARQVVFLKLSGQVQRKMGLKAINMGANAVIGYTQCFDLEGDVGVVARGIGTAVTLIKDTSSQPATADNALIEERTTKYLEFLNGASIGLSEKPAYKLQIKKSHSSTLFDLRRSNSVADNTEIMHELMRQEDERGEKPVKKLKQHMQRIKHSSRHILNEKYSQFMRKLGDSSDSKSTENTSRSLSSLFSSGFIKEESLGSTYDVRKQSFKARTPKRPSRKIIKRQSFIKVAHPIVRSISDDTAMKCGIANKIAPPNISAISEFQDNTRSSPNICPDAQQAESVATAVTACNSIDDRDHQLFGQYPKHDELLISNCDTLQSSSSTTISLTLSGSSSSSEESKINFSVLEPSMLIDENEEKQFDEDIEYNNLERIQVEKLLKLCSVDEDEIGEQKWIHPGGQSLEDGLPELKRRHSILTDLKAFSHHLQDLIHIPKRSTSTIIQKTNPMNPKSNTLKSLRRAPPTTLPLKCLTVEGAHKSYYSSQPEMLNECCCDANTSLALPQITHSYSLTNLTKSATASISALATPTPLPLVSSSKFDFPVLQICPSTPTPESDHSQLSPSYITTKSTLKNNSQSFNYYSSKLPKAQLNRNSYTNHSNQIKPLLLSPSSTYTTAKLCTIVNNHRHRSLNEINVPSNSAAVVIMESPGMKRFASPASAAVAASAAATTNASSLLESRSKLSPSPSKAAITAPASTPSQTDSVSSTTTTSTATTMIPKEIGEMCRRSSDSDLSVATPKGNSFCVASERLVAATAMMRLSQPITGKNANAADSMDMLEYPFLTMTKYPPGFILHLGATVAARSVKLLERVPNPDEPEVRDSWWTELRMEIRSHARALGCNVVLGYSESTTISDEVCVLSATGTAAVINMAYNRSVSQTDIFSLTKSAGMSASLEERDILKEVRNGVNNDVTSFGTTQAGKKTGLPPLSITKTSCSMCHIPYNLASVPFNVKMKKCAICGKGRVPDVLLATLEVPEYLQVTGRGCFMQAQVVRAKKDLRSELNAKEISDGLPFLEYELHRVLINKLKAKGMNAIFGLKAQVAIGERMIALIVTGTALFLSALPVPSVPKIVAGNTWTDKQKLNELQKKLQETFERNQEIYQLKCMDPDLMSGSGMPDKHSDTDESDDEVIEVDLNCGNKDTCVLEVDDIEDLEIISLLMEPYPPEGFHVVNTQMVPGMVDMEAVKNLQMFTQVWRAKLDVGQGGFPKHFQRLLQTIFFKLRTMIPCAICDLRFRLDLPESDQIQLLVTGMALGLGDANKFKYRRKTINSNVPHDATTTTSTTNANNYTARDTRDGGSHKRCLQEEDYIFPLDEDQMVETPTPTTNMPQYGTHSLKLRKTSPSRTTSKSNAAMRNRYLPVRDRYGVDITPLSFIPGGKIEKYLGNLNFFFIRESTSVRENGGISGFVHGFITELLAVVRAHITALGGNAMVSFYMTELILVDNQHKNQGQCLISIGGDAVSVSYYADD